MKRIIMMVLRLNIIAIYYFTILCKKSRAEIKNFDKNYQWLKKVTTNVNKAGKVTIEASGIENLPKDNGFVIFPNHQGLYDTLAFIESCPRTLSFVIKKGLLAILNVLINSIIINLILRKNKLNI